LFLLLGDQRVMDERTAVAALAGHAALPQHANHRALAGSAKLAQLALGADRYRMASRWRAIDARGRGRSAAIDAALGG
jgi:hypothetical protein